MSTLRVNTQRTVRAVVTNGRVKLFCRLCGHAIRHRKGSTWECGCGTPSSLYGAVYHRRKQQLR